ncbi:MAG: EAL domain-containing protein [Alphaproteobacteria bacterium]|nr:EAL domain-containing protein [Alphaproteobacteria bacterium]
MSTASRTCWRCSVPRHGIHHRRRYRAAGGGRAGRQRRISHPHLTLRHGAALGRLQRRRAPGASHRRPAGRPFEIEDLAVTFEAHIGLSRFPNLGSDAQALARCALVALKECNIAGETFSVFDPVWDSDQRERYRLLRDLRQAIDRDDELLLHYQPKVDLRNVGCIVVEALLLWQHPTRGMVPPASFIPATEQTTMIHEVTERGVTMGLERLVRWGLEGRILTMSVNLSARDLADLNIAERIGNIVKFYSSRPTHLEFEMTETAIMENPRLAANNIDRLKALGDSVAIDDFGTGHSSLAYLAEMPCYTLKIDRAFVDSINDGTRNRSIVRAAIGLAHALGMTVVA